MATIRKKRVAEPAKLANGEYIARSRDKSLITAVVNGHSSIWPEARMVVDGADAVFYKGRKKVWGCQAMYAANMFDIIPAEPKKAAQ